MQGFARFVGRSFTFAALASGASSGIASAQASSPTMAPVNDLPNPYKTITDWPKLPSGRTWGSMSAVDIDRDGKSVWVAERCGTNSCATSTLDPVMKFDPNGNVVAHFGSGMIVSPHGLTVDKDGNIWVVDCACTGGGGRGRGGGRGADSAAGGRAAAPVEAPKGHQIYKFSPDGKLLMTLGKAGGGRGTEFFTQPNNLLVAPNGDLFVVEGHSSRPDAQGVPPAARVFRFSKDGKLIKAWGQWGSGPDDFDQPHAVAMDSKGRLFVGDRGNNRIKIFDGDGKLLDTWYQWSRPSGIFIDAQDNMYVADSESGTVNPAHGAWKRGIRIGSAKDGSVKYFIPDPDLNATGTSSAEGVVVDAAGHIYGAEVGPQNYGPSALPHLKRYEKK
jgi:DNA-binding beta-propeller fold protein YncE